METNRQKKIGGVIQKDLVDILQGEVRKNEYQLDKTRFVATCSFAIA